MAWKFLVTDASFNALRDQAPVCLAGLVLALNATKPAKYMISKIVIKFNLNIN
jgi:hypothetical protein